MYKSVPILSQLVSDFSNLFLVESFSYSIGLLNSLFVPFLSSFSSFWFELFNEVLFSPSDLAWKIAQFTELSEAAQLDSSQSIRNDLSLFSVIWSWNSFEYFKSTKSWSSNGSFMWKHTSDSSPENSWWSSVMYMTSCWVG